MNGGTEKEAGWLLTEKYGGVSSSAYLEDLKLLEAGVPLAYLIDHVPFLDATIYLDSRPLIPRTETEFWVEKAIAEIREREKFSPAADKPLRILDLCAGSGCIGVALLKAFPKFRVDFAEIDPSHHATIEKNIRENGIAENRTAIFGGDLFENVPSTLEPSRSDAVRGASEASDQAVETYSAGANERGNDEMRQGWRLYDYIFSNPPYIDPVLKSRVEPSVALHEPELALFGGEDGMECITRIIEEAPDFLSAGGTLYLEHEPEQTLLIAGEAKVRGYSHVTTEKDQYDVLRMTKMSTESVAQ